MRWSEITLLVVAVLLVLGWLAWVFASRLDRLHRKVVASRMALDAQLVRRAVAAADLAAAGVLDPASSVLVIAASVEVSTGDEHGDYELVAALPDLASAVGSRSTPRPSRSAVSRALDDGLGPARTQAESNLSATLREVLSDEAEVARLYAVEASADLLGSLAGAWYRVQLARRFHNESVDQARSLRQGTFVRVLHLAGRATMPQTVDLDDAWPPLLHRPAGATAI